MKKFMFTAVAMIAFVGSSRASDIAEREFQYHDSKKVELKNQENGLAFIWLTRCDVIYLRTYSIAFEEFNNTDAANAIAMSAAKTCAQLEAK